MSQRLRMMIKKDGSAKGVAIRKTSATKNNPQMLKTLFTLAYNENLKRKNGTSKSKTS